MGYGQADQTDREMMALALAQARISLDGGGVPVGAVLAVGGDVIAAGHNERVQRGDPVAHGEISCLRNAGRRPSYLDTTLYTTLSPCQMCTGAILLFQIPRVVVGEAQTFAGDLPFLADRGVEIVLLDDEGCMAAMQEFQTRYPQIWSEDIGGRYCEDCHVAEIVPADVSPVAPGVRSYALDPANAKALWEISEQLVGEKF